MAEECSWCKAPKCSKCGLCPKIVQLVSPNGSCECHNQTIEETKQIIKETEKMALLNGSLSEPQTQKAKGIKALQSFYGYPYEFWGRPPSAKFILPADWTYVSQHIDKIFPPDKEKKYFARPCPITPRHGFVDSRMVTNSEELHEIIKETRAADIKGELVLMKFLKPEWSAVWTPHMITFGPGHDGATSGGEGVFSIPLCGQIEPALESVLKLAGVTETPFIEIVGRGMNPQMVQLRSGPKVNVGDYIPTKTTVKCILRPNGEDLLAWEKRVKEFKGTDGLVVEHVNGSPSDHYSIHCRCHEIPTVFRPIEVGETLEPIPTVPIDPQSVLRGLVASERISMTASAAHAMVLALHQSAAFQGKDGFWLGLGVGILLRYGAAALKGEARHLKPNNGISRSSIYTKAFGLSLSQLKASVPKLITLFRYGAFDGSSIGGPRWAECAYALGKVFDAVGVLARRRDQAAVNGLLETFNVAINQAHNNGWWLNKFTSLRTFNAASTGSLVTPVNAVLTLNEAREPMNEAHINRRIKRWAGWRKIKARVPKITSAKLLMVGSGLRINLQSKLLGEHHRPVKISQRDLFLLMKADLEKGLVIQEAPNGGMRVELERPHLDPITLHEETAEINYEPKEIL